MTEDGSSGLPAAGSRLYWHQALAFAVVGERLADLGTQPAPNAAEVIGALAAREPGGLDALQASIRSRLTAGQPWPYEVPADLRQGLGAAQWLAALADLRQRLAVDPAPQQVRRDRPLDADEARLLRDVPPHHGH